MKPVICYLAAQYLVLLQTELLIMLIMMSNYRKFLPVKNLAFQACRMVKHLAQEEAINVDLELFNTYKFSVSQLMELAGLSCAHSVAKCYPDLDTKSKPLLVLCGPGNNGGDGLVMARHLQQLGYKPQLFYPKRTEKELYRDLVVQAELSDIAFIDTLPSSEQLATTYSLLVDCVFGFSFKPPVRPQFSPILDTLSKVTIPLVCVDIPSGWDVELGPPTDGETPVLCPDLLISLTAPKQCAKKFTGRFHYLGGRFVPRRLAEKYQLDLPEYPGTECCVQLD